MGRDFKRNYQIGEQYGFLAKYVILSSIKIADTVHLQINLSFSKDLRICETEASNLTGKRSTAMWGKWECGQRMELLLAMKIIEKIWEIYLMD
jgi:hypothetical protein